MPLQRRWSRNLDQRWRAVERMLPGALSQHPATMIAHALAIGAGNPVDLFSQWLTEAIKQVVMGDDGSWLLPYVRSATDAGALHARKLSQGTAEPTLRSRSTDLTSLPTGSAAVDRTHLLQSFAINELQGIVDATSQQAARAYAQGLLNKLTPQQIVSSLRSVLSTVGINRGHAFVSFMTVKSFNSAALDGFRASGVQRVGLVPERRPPVRVQTRDADLSGMVSVLTAEDDLVCPECEEIADDGPYYIDEAEALIPAHPHCILPGAVVEGSVVAAMRSRYDGPAVKIETRAGSSLSLTVNHPVLTTRGWVRSGELRLGDQIVSKRSEIWGSIASDVYPNDHNPPAKIEQVFDSLWLRGFSSVKPSCDDLHGDARFVDGHVDVVFVDRRLLRHYEATLSKQSRQSSLVLSDQSLGLGVGYRASVEFFLRSSRPFDSVVGSFDLVGTLLTSHPGPLETLCLGRASNWKVVKPESSLKSSAVHAKFLRALLERQATEVQLDEVIDIERFAYSGHVYDLQTETGYIVAQGLVISNCRCAFAPADEDEADDFDQEDLGDSVTHIASGVMITADNTGRTLFVRRGPNGNHPGEWAFPAGAVEPGETVQQAAARETHEEIGYEPDQLDQVHRQDWNGVDFTTYAHTAETEFRPRLNHEHDGYAWRHIENAPQPLHPGVVVTLSALKKQQSDELADDQTWNEEDHPRDKDGKFTFAGGGGTEAALDNVGADVGHIADLKKAEKGTDSGYDEITVPLEHSHLVAASLDKHGLDYDKIPLTKKDVYFVKGMKSNPEDDVNTENTSSNTGKIEHPAEGSTLAKVMMKQGATSLENYPPEGKSDKNSHVFTVQNQHKDIVENLLKNSGYEYTTFSPSVGAKTGYKVPLSSSYTTSLIGQKEAPPQPSTEAPVPPPAHPSQKYLSQVKGTTAERVAWRKELKTAKGDAKTELQHKIVASFWKQHTNSFGPKKEDLAANVDKYSKSYGIANPLKQTSSAPTVATPAKAFGKLGVEKTPEPLPSHTGPGGQPGALDFKSLTKVGEQKGSNPGGVYQSPTGDRYYIKSMDEAHARNELLAARLYSLAGSKTLDYVPVKPDGDVHYVATKFETLDKDNVSKLSPSERAQARGQFATHAWLANWDAAGTGGDNQGTKGGLVKTLDVGGSLEYRAQGTPKGAAFGNEVNEFDTLRDPNKNHDAAKLFGDMSDEAIKNSVNKVGAIHDNDIRNIVESIYGINNKASALSNKLIARKNDLVARSDALGKAPKGDDLSHMSDEEQRIYWLKKTINNDGFGSGNIDHHLGTNLPESKKAKIEKMGLTPGEVGFIRAFTGPESGVNNNLRDGHMDEHEFAFKHIMNDALAKMPVYDGDKVWRKINLKPDQQAKYVPGKIVHWQAFSSTSKNPDTWSGNTHFTIHNPKSGRDVQFISENPSEAEVIMPADTYYKVLGKKTVGGTTHIDLQEVLPFGKKQKKVA